MSARPIGRMEAAGAGRVSPGKILVVDDDAALCDTLKDVFTGDGHHVGIARDGKAGLRELANDHYDVVITDLNMPEMEGLELLSHIRKSQFDVCPIVLTGFGTIEAAVESMKLGAYDYVLKPFNVNEFREVVWKCLARVREEREHPIRVDRLKAETAEGLLEALEAKDRYTRGHSERVGRYARILAEGLNLGDGDVRLIEQAGRLHDIGKIGVRLEHLNKRGPLTVDEHELYKLHVSYGKTILDVITPFRNLSEMAYHHHERFDGNGYLAGVQGADIPLGGRILVICDGFDAMTSDRPYRSRLPLGVAVQELLRCSGTQFDPDLVQVFVRRLKELHRPEELEPEEIVIARESSKGGLGPLIFTKRAVDEGEIPEWESDGRKTVPFERY
ncbi:MAG: response regulator [Nitrospirae bacterium]|nr:response regulator [Nitrospirota bacterium]